MNERTDEEISRDFRWSNELGIWFTSRDLEEFNRYFNGFGIDKSDPILNIKAFVKLTFPISINRTIAGAFAKERRNVYVIHRDSLAEVIQKIFLVILQNKDEKKVISLLLEI